MGRSRSHSNQRDKQKKIRKQKKQKKQKKHKKEYQNQKAEKNYQLQKSQKQLSIQSQNQNKIDSKKIFSQEPQNLQKTHINCRRCKNQSFSLKTRTCYKCGYPKQQRPMHFPVVKQVNPMQLVRQGKLIHNSYAPVLIEVVVNDRMGKKQRIKCCPTDSIYDFKKLISAQIGTRPQKIRLQKSNIIYKDQLTLQDYQIKDGMGLEMYYD